MSKKNRNKKKDYLDVSYRKKISFDLDQKYSDEELEFLIIEMVKQINRLNDFHKKFYSTNAYIERIYNRSFLDIIREKLISTYTNIICIHSKKKEKRKS